VTARRARWPEYDPPMGTEHLPLFQRPVPFAKGSDTSRAAAEEMQGEAARLRRSVLAAYRTAGHFGMTPDQCAKLLHVSVLACRPRCTELLQAGLLERTGERRKNQSGLNANVLRASNR
jgi:hypothetical protein